MTIDCFFLHHSLMSALEAEQRRFRAVARPGQSAPFGFITPFCPCTSSTLPADPVLGAVEAHDGWILRPVSGPGSRPASEFSLRIEWPHFLPPLPGKTGFLLGYAGEEAANLVSEIESTDGPAGAKPSPPLPGPEGLPIRVWYQAKLSVVIEREEAAFISVRYEIGPARWTRADRKGAPSNEGHR